VVGSTCCITLRLLYARGYRARLNAAAEGGGRYSSLYSPTASLLRRVKRGVRLHSYPPGGRGGMHFAESECCLAVRASLFTPFPGVPSAHHDLAAYLSFNALKQ